MVLDLARSAADEAEARAWADDSAFLLWAEGGSGASIIAAELKVRTQGNTGHLPAEWPSLEVRRQSGHVELLMGVPGWDVWADIERLMLSDMHPNLYVAVILPVLAG